MNGELPDFGLEGDERELLPELTEPDVADGMAAEARVLAAALRAESEDDAIVAAQEFLGLRGDRRATMSSGAIALERSLEWTEGLARYADMALVEAATEEYRPTPEFATLSGYPSSDALVDELLGWLDDVTAVPGTVRDRYYEVGAGQARLLDRLMPGWHSRALPDGQALESVLEEAVEGADDGIAPTLRALGARTVSVAGTQLSVGVADRPAFWSSGLAGVHTLEPLDGVLFVFPHPVDAAFTNRGMAFALDVFFFDSDRTLVDTRTMPACPEGPCDAFEVRAAFQYTLEVPAGSVALSAGDLLDLDKEG